MKTIQDFLQKQQVHQLHQKPRSVPSFKPINVYSANDQWQIDLIDFSKYSRWNAGFKYLFCGVDVFSRKAYVVAIKSKSDTTEAMRFILAARKPMLVQSDNGTEFLNNSFQSLLKENKVRQITVNVGDHNRQSLIESSIGHWKVSLANTKSPEIQIGTLMFWKISYIITIIVIIWVLMIPLNQDTKQIQRLAKL
jgi:transposase InsO family protein